MSNPKPTIKKDFAYMVRKYLIVVFVVASFAAYTLHDKTITSNSAAIAPSAQLSGQVSQTVPVVTIYPTATGTPYHTDVPQVASLPSATVMAEPIGPVRPPTSPDATATQHDTSPAPTRTQQPPPTETPAPTAVTANGAYKDGQYTGNVADAFYGPLEVKVVIQKGKIVDVQVLDYPHDRRRSAVINDQALPWLHDEVISTQSAQVDMISGATLTSQAYIESLQTALNSAKS
jgi:uncharacterized protein with FMN-binding domain